LRSNSASRVQRIKEFPSPLAPRSVGKRRILEKFQKQFDLSRFFPAGIFAVTEPSQRFHHNLLMNGGILAEIHPKETDPENPDPADQVQQPSLGYHLSARRHE